jgi:hypothetical protein
LREIEIGDFWAVKLPDGTYGCVQVTDVRRSGVGSRSSVIVAVVDWSGSEQPSRDQIEGRQLLIQGLTRIEAFTKGEATILGNVRCEGTARMGANVFHEERVGEHYYVWGWNALAQVAANALGRQPNNAALNGLRPDLGR